MNISSILLRTNPEKRAAVLARLADMPDVQVHTDLRDGRFVLLIEASAARSCAEAFASLHDIDGVISASLVYQYCDDMHSEEHE